MVRRSSVASFTRWASPPDRVVSCPSWMARPSFECAASWRCAASFRRTQAPRLPSSPARQRCSCPYTLPPAFRGCSAPLHTSRHVNVGQEVHLYLDYAVLHASHLPPFTLKLKRPGLELFAPGVMANTCGSGRTHGIRAGSTWGAPYGRLVDAMTLSRCSAGDVVVVPWLVKALFRSRASLARMMLFTRVLCPTRHARDIRTAPRYADIDVFQVVLPAPRNAAISR